MFMFPSVSGINFDWDNLKDQLPWLALLFLLYPLLGWLFGSYTVLRWRRLSISVLLQRLLITGIALLFVVAIARGLINPSDALWIFSRRVQLIWTVGLSVWSFAVRVGLRQGLLVAELPKILLLVQSHELGNILLAWSRVPHRQLLHPVDLASLSQKLDLADESILVAFSHSVSQDPLVNSLLSRIEIGDQRQARSISVLSLFAQQQERLPPVLMADVPLAYDDLPWAAPFNFQTQLKRMADLLLAAVLLLFTAPLVLLASILILLEDGGPVLYVQKRSGWLGRPFTVYKLRTMTVQPSNSPALWTQPGDQRITLVGDWLRRLRLDELPQLLMC